MINTPLEIAKNIDELMHVSGKAETDTVWIYGEMLWADPTAFKFVVERCGKTKRVSIMTEQVRRYRDGESDLFLIEMSPMTARILGLGEYLLGADELDQKKRGCYMERPY